MTQTLPYAVTDAVGLPETRLPDALVSRLPETAAAAPWRTRCQVVTWLHAVDPEALDAFPAAIRPVSVAMVAWALVRYDETPVGPYSEVAATLIPAEGDGYGHIPFIVVDSPASVVGGRANWLLPKALARFAWSDDNRSVAVRPDQPAAPAWRIDLRWEPAGDATDLSVDNHVEQVGASGIVGRFDGTMRGALSPATVTVDGEASGALAALLTPGRYDGTSIADASFDVGALTPR